MINHHLQFNVSQKDPTRVYNDTMNFSVNLVFKCVGSFACLNVLLHAFQAAAGEIQELPLCPEKINDRVRRHVLVSHLWRKGIIATAGPRDRITGSSKLGGRCYDITSFRDVTPSKSHWGSSLSLFEDAARAIQWEVLPLSRYLSQLSTLARLKLYLLEAREIAGYTTPVANQFVETGP
ncbi:uncharacterized protein BJ212DRAFT_1303417 [Suillus subaureus]|uniref:Uncharacterized protein n=1 Tax=Suillus subaureus TaxID=48587 RepID=A0A9P7DZY2_9AGAM|nr:uncharacterized protein BJ212DRAFT_1303417 [Suillus subaureus]KAG1807444.1 hypothetical protein BJ212DRAFT_1303417 [Suillus subaureus]